MRVRGVGTLLALTLAVSIAHGGDAPPAAPLDFTLANGLRVHLRPLEGARSVALCTLFGVGEDNDFPEPCGTAHLVEHVFVTAATSATSARAVGDLDRLYPDGWNAGTGSHNTFFEFVFLPERLPEELADAAARMRDLRPTDADLAREKPRIAQELRTMYDSNTGLAAINRARERAASWATGCRRHGGHAPDLPLKAVRTRWSMFYRAGNARLAVAGRIDPVAVRKEIERVFADVPRGDVPRGVAGPPGTPGDPEPPRIEQIAVDADPGEGRRVGIVAEQEWLPIEARRLAPRLILLARLWKHEAEFGASEFPAPIEYAPLDGMFDVVFCVTPRPGEDGAVAARRIEALVNEARATAPTSADLAIVESGVGRPFGLGDPPETATNPRLAARSAAWLAEWKLTPTALRAALKAVTRDDLQHRFLPEFGGYDGVIVVPKKR